MILTYGAVWLMCAIVMLSFGNGVIIKPLKHRGKACVDTATDCAARAEAGHCLGFPGWMVYNCPVSCKFCDKLDYTVRCNRNNLNISEPAYTAGNMEQMFRELPGKLNTMYGIPESAKRLSLANKRLKVLSTDPWVVTIDKFVTHDEIDGLISMQPDPSEWERSKGVNASITEADPMALSRQIDAFKGEEAIVVDGSVTSSGSSSSSSTTSSGSNRKLSALLEDATLVTDAGRTSTNSWCNDECEQHPAVNYLIRKIQYLVNIPHDNFENFQVLKYEVGQHYGTHHDYIDLDRKRPAGPRILTFFLYLNDVEEGGETAFPLLNISVKPKKGRALLWPSSLDSDPEAIDSRTVHAALPVIKGRKFAANYWMHLYNFKVATAWGCTGLSFNQPPLLT